MRRPLLPFTLIATLSILASGCSPTFNWRVIRVEPTALVALLPCKPDRGTRVVPLAGKDTAMAMVGCEAGGATFAVAHADVGGPEGVAAAMTAWRSAALLNMRGQTVVEQAQRVPGADGAVPPVLVKATGRSAEGTPVQSQAVYFSQSGRVFQAVIYAETLPADVADTFFSGIKFQ